LLAHPERAQTAPIVHVPVNKVRRLSESISYFTLLGSSM
jgi:hypothetical protein